MVFWQLQYDITANNALEFKSIKMKKESQFKNDNVGNNMTVQLQLKQHKRV